MTGNSWFEYSKGANGDGEVNIADINALLGRIFDENRPQQITILQPVIGGNSSKN
jgi:hypothetical protein